MNKSTAPDNCYNDWQTPPGKTKKAHVACHLVFIKDFKKRHDNLINISNISRKKALTKHENVVVKAFFCGDRCSSPKFVILRIDSGRLCKSENLREITLSRRFDTRRQVPFHLDFSTQGETKSTCLKTEERFNAGDEVENSINQDESALSRDRVRGVYIYGARLKKPRN